MLEVEFVNIDVMVRYFVHATSITLSVKFSPTPGGSPLSFATNLVGFSSHDPCYGAALTLFGFTNPFQIFLTKKLILR